jgi:polyhydroxybutyrate depolymerase
MGASWPGPAIGARLARPDEGIIRHAMSVRYRFPGLHLHRRLLMTRPAPIAIAIAIFSQVFAAAEPVLARDIEKSMEIGGFQRSYTVFIPDRLQQSQGPFPAVIMLHGGLGNGSIIRRQMRMDAVAEREGFAVIYPDGLGRGWNDGRVDRARQRGPYGSAGDVAFLKSIVDTLTRDNLVLGSQVFLSGVSNGGMMSLRMGCEAAEFFAGIAPIIASIPEDIAGTCKPSRPVPLLLINATEDPLVPWDGGGVGFAGGRGQVISTTETIAFWHHINGCSPEEKNLTFTQGASGNGTGVKGNLFRDCRSGAPVALVSIEGGGHRIPGREDRAHPIANWFLGRQNHDFETAEEVWHFFASYGSRGVK